MGSGRRAARRDPDGRRDPRQYRGLLEAEAGGEGRRRHQNGLQAVLAERQPASADRRRPRRGDPHRPRRRAGQAGAHRQGQLEIRHRFHGRTADRHGAALRHQAGGERLARQGQQSLRRQNRRHRAVAGGLRRLRAGQAAGRSALLPESRRQDADRDLALPVLPAAAARPERGPFRNVRRSRASPRYGWRRSRGRRPARRGA